MTAGPGPRLRSAAAEPLDAGAPRAKVLVIGVLGAIFPAIVLTLVLVPLWRWLDARTGIESLGHSGPATWCFAAVWAVLALCFVAARRRNAARAWRR